MECVECKHSTRCLRREEQASQPSSHDHDSILIISSMHLGSISMRIKSESRNPRFLYAYIYPYMFISSADIIS